MENFIFCAVDKEIFNFKYLTLNEAKFIGNTFVKVNSTKQ